MTTYIVLLNFLCSTIISAHPQLLDYPLYSARIREYPMAFRLSDVTHIFRFARTDIKALLLFTFVTKRVANLPTFKLKRPLLPKTSSSETISLYSPRGQPAG